MVESTANSYNDKLHIEGNKVIENNLYDYFEELYGNETAQESENSMNLFDNSLYESWGDEEFEEADEIKKVVAEKENNEAEVIKSSDTSNLVSNTVALPNVQAVKTENIFVFTLNYVYKLLSLFINLITALIENLQWIIMSTILTVAAYHIFKKGGIDDLDSLVEMIKTYLN